MTEDLLTEFEPDISQLILVPSDEGRFEVEVDGDLVYSKLETGRHAQPGEVVELVRKKIKG